MPTDKLFTGQRLDATVLYYYNARYYDPLIGRFISPDTVIPNPANPQSFNRYSYCFNNPLKYDEPSGHGPYEELMSLAAQHAAGRDVAPGEIGRIIEGITHSALIPVIASTGSGVWLGFNDIYEDHMMTISYDYHYNEESGEEMPYYRIDVGIRLVMTEEIYNDLVSRYSMEEIYDFANGILKTLPETGEHGTVLELYAFFEPKYNMSWCDTASPISGIPLGGNPSPIAPIINYFSYQVPGPNRYFGAVVLAWGWELPKFTLLPRFYMISHMFDTY